MELIAWVPVPPGAKAHTPSPSPPKTTRNARSATAARRCVSRRDASGVTRRYAGRRRGRRSWARTTTRSSAPPAAVFALADAARTAVPAAWTLSASGIGERSGAPASGSAGLTGTSVRWRAVALTSVASKAIAPSLPLPSAATNRWWRCSIADCGWSVSMASLSSSGPRRATTFGLTSTSESPNEISPRHTSGSSSPDGRPRSRCGSGSVERRAWRMRYASAGPTVATYISLPRTTATPTPIGPLPPGLRRPSRSLWWASRLLAVAIAFWRQTRIPADSS